MTALLFTPFGDDGHFIDAPSMQRQVDRVVKAGVDNVVACGKAGEFEGLKPVEIEEVLTIVQDQVGGRVAVGIGIISVEEPEALRAADIGAGCGVDFAMVKKKSRRSLRGARLSQDRLFCLYHTDFADVNSEIRGAVLREV